MKVKWLLRAANDLDDLYRYIALDDLNATSNEVDKVLAAAAQLVDMPDIGRPGRLSDTRELIVSTYIIAYRVRNNRLEILRVLHQARKWPARIS